MFLSLTTENRDGCLEPRIVAVVDISMCKPAVNAAPARTCVSLRSQPDFPIWAIEDMAEIKKALARMGAAIAPTTRAR